MVESLLLSLLPKWKHAGQRSDGVISHPAPAEIAAEDPKHPIVMVDMQPYKIITISAKDEHGYLVPHYKTDDPHTSDVDVSRRDIGLLSSRVKKFFYSAQPGLDIFRTKEQLDKSLRRLKPLFKEFSFDKSYKDLSDDERALVNDAAQTVGHAVNRLGALGAIIIQGDRHNVKIEYDDAYIDEHMADICKEFEMLWADLAFSEEGRRMIACVMTRGEYKDHDGVFGHLIREIGKPVMGHIPHKSVKNTYDDGTFKPQDVVDAEVHAMIEKQSLRAEEHTRSNLVQDIGATMLAIDQVNNSMHVMMDHELFGPFARSTQSAINHNLLKDIRPTKDLDLTNYRGMVREFTDLSKARVGIRSEDSEDFDPIDRRLKTLRGEIKFCHDAMEAFAKQKGDKIALATLPLLERGVDLISEMTELRLPRNKHASGMEGRQTTVERYAEKVESLRAGKMSGRSMEDD